MPERSLATVLFLDMVGSTERASELGDRRWRKLLHDFHRCVGREISSFGGRQVSSAGDGFLATFSDPERAILCACALRDSLRAMEIEIRTGLHMGEVDEVRSNVAGIAVHIGARVAGLAMVGEVLVSSTVRDGVHGSGVVFEDRGTHQLRGVPGEWHLYAVAGIPEEVAKEAESLRRKSWRLPRLRGRVVAAAGVGLILLILLIALLVRQVDKETRVSELGPADPAIAVLPFTVDHPDLQSWREGMVHLLSTDLDGIEGLRAIDSRTLLARWRERVKDDDPADLETSLQVARDTGARYAVLGTLVPEGRNVRFDAEVHDLQTGRELGQPTLVGPADSILASGDRLAIQILWTIKGGDLTQVRTRIMTESLLAFRAYLDGEALFRHSDFEGAIEAYQRAIDADSTFALALSRLAMAYGWVEGITTRELLSTVGRLVHHFDRLPERDQLLVVGGSAFAHGQIEAIGAFQQAVLKYPDDLESWNLLGDAHYHLAGPDLASEGTVDEDFSKALALDSSFTPAYIHLIEDAFHRADSARVGLLVQAYGRFAPGTRFDRRQKLAYALAFGDSASRTAALAALDTVPSPVLESLVPNLRNARFLAVQESVLTKIAARPDNPDRAATGIFAFMSAARSGRLEAALQELANPRTPAWFRSDGAYLLHALHLPVSEEQLERVVEDTGALTQGSEVASGPSGSRAFYAGALAVDRGDSTAQVAALFEIRTEEAQRLAAGDSAGARFLGGVADALTGYGGWKKTHDQEALKLLDNARRIATGLDQQQIDVNATIRWWLGEIALELGRPREAEKYWASLERDPLSVWQHPLVTYRLAQVYERLGEDDQARAAYDVVAAAWSNADPRARSMVADTNRP